MKQNTTFFRAGPSSARRAALLGTVAASALCLAALPAAAGPDACATSGDVVTCSGNQSGGIEAGVDFAVSQATTLNINNLTQDIGSLSNGSDGILWAVGAGPININSNTGSFSIDAAAHGMYLYNHSGDPITVSHTGNIRAGLGNGIDASAIGFGGIGVGNAGAISLTMNGNIVANVGISVASDVQSGNGNAAAVTVDFTGNIVSRNGAIEARSRVHAGNGNSGPVTIQSKGSLIGGIGASSTVAGNGNAGSVSVSHQNSLGAGAHGGIRAQSVVGGIGNAAVVTVDNAGNISNQYSAILAGSLAQTDGNAGPVLVTNVGDVTAGASGILAESFATGAGSAGGAIINSIGNIRTDGSGLEATSSATGAGNAKVVAVNNNGNIETGTFGIIARSSAATGNAGDAAVVSRGNISSGAGAAIFAESHVSGITGNAGNVTVISTGNINAAELGIHAQSTAAAGNAGAVTVTVVGNVTGQDGPGILARSFAPGGTAGNITVSINDGVVRGGSSSTGVTFQGGATNLLTVGSNAALSSLSGLAVLGDAGNETIFNSGTVTGGVMLGAGVNAFNNLAGATFNAGTIVDLGAAGLLTNTSMLAPGGRNSAPVTTALTGNLVQAAGGTFAVDVRNGAADRINVTGTAALAGTVLPTVSGLAAPTQQFTILSAAGGTTNNGIALAVQDTAVLDYSLLFPNANDMVLAVTANFLPTGANLTPNQRVTAGHLQGALVGGGGNLGGLLGYLGGFMDVGAYAKALDRLHPEPYLAQVQSGLLASLAFTDGLMSCPTAASPNASAFVAEGQCAWARMGGRTLNVTRSTANIGYDDTSWGGSAGVQVALAPSWFGSLAFGYERSDLRVDNRARATGDLFHAGASVKYVRGNWQVTGALTGGHASYDTTRFGVMPGVNASADPSMSFVSGRVRAAYVIGNDNAYVKPLVDLDATTIRRGGFTERGAAAAGLNVRGQTDTVLSVAPAVEVGGQFALAGASWLRPFLRAGVRVFGTDELSATASFIGSPTTVSAFTATTPLDRWMGEVASGLEILSGDRFDARLGYEGRFGERATQHGGNLKLRAKF